MSSVPREVHDLILERDNHSCVACARTVSGERGRDYSIHHRIPAGMGGSRHEYVVSLANFQTLCGSGTTGCHGLVERERETARHFGYLIRGRRTDPATAPVWIASVPDGSALPWAEWPGDGQWVYLTADGGKSIDEPGAAPRDEESETPAWPVLDAAEVHQLRTVYPRHLHGAAVLSDLVASIDELAAAEAAAGGAA